MIMHVRLTFVLTLRVPVRIVGMTHSRVVVLMRVARAQVLETTGRRVVIVRHMKMMMSVGQTLVVMLLPVFSRSIIRHGHSRSRGLRAQVSYPGARVL